MKDSLTPRDLAAAVGASESSLRRWVDSGEIRTYRTTGGHRRIPVAEAIRFMRESGVGVVQLDALGIGGTGSKDGPAVADELFESLRTGQAQRAAGLAMSLMLAGESPASIFDGPLRESMHRIGELWQHDRAGILQEHRATEICAWVISHMRQALSPAKPDAPLALGGAVADDVYTIPSQMADLVLSDAGFRTINYGARTPSDLLADAAEEHNAALVWVSISVNLPKEQLRVAMQRLARRLADRSTPLIIGGRHSSDVRLREFPNVVMANSMGDLATFAKGMLLARRASH